MALEVRRETEATAFTLNCSMFPIHFNHMYEFCLREKIRIL